MQPEQSPYPSQSPPNPQIYGPAGSPQTPPAGGTPPGQPFAGGPKPSKIGKSKLPLIIIGGVVGLFIILVIVAALMRPEGNNQNPPDNQTDQTGTTDPEGPQPATALDIEQTDNSITQDITSLNDDNDFPESELSDDSLSL